MQYLDTLRWAAVLIVWGGVAGAITYAFSRSWDNAKIVFLCFWGGIGLALLALTAITFVTNTILGIGA